MLVYHSVFDVFHTVFRMMQLIHHLETKEIELDRFRMMDFYLVFPGELRKFNFKELGSEFQKYKKVLPKEENRYESIDDPFKTLERMRPYQMDAIRFLISYGYLESKAFESKNIIKILNKEIPIEIIESWSSTARPVNKNALLLLIGGFSTVIFYGEKGLKSKTGLLVHKYDPKNVI